MQRDSMHQGLKTTTTKIKRISFFDSLYFDEKLMQSIALEKRGLLYCIGRRGGGHSLLKYTLFQSIHMLLLLLSLIVSHGVKPRLLNLLYISLNTKGGPN